MDLANLTPESISNLSTDQCLDLIRSLRMARRAPRTIAEPKARKAKASKSATPTAAELDAMTPEQKLDVLLALLS